MDEYEVTQIAPVSVGLNVSAEDELTQISVASIGNNDSATDDITQIAPISVGVNENALVEITQIAVYSITSQPIYVPQTLALTLTEFQPTVSIEQVVTPGALALTLTEFQPTVTVSNQLVTPQTAVLTLTEMQLTVTVSDQLVTPQTAVLTLTEFAPVISSTGNHTVTPSTRALTLTELKPRPFNSLLPTGSMKKNNPGCCTCGGTPSCTCVVRTCWSSYTGALDSDVPHALKCKCLFPDGCPDTLGSVTLTIAGSGTPYNDGIPCSTVACSWAGTFVVACDTGGFAYDEFQKYTYICDGAFGKYYYRHSLKLSYQSQGVWIKTVTNRAGFSISVEMQSNVVFFSFAGSQPTTGTWLNEIQSGTPVDGYSQSQVIHQWSGTLLEFQVHNVDETNCATEPCNPFGELVECNTLFSLTTTHDTQGQGCYPDPANVTVTPSW